MIDCFDGMVVSWSLGTRPDAELVNTMLDTPIETVIDTEGRPVVHADRGAHCRWEAARVHRSHEALKGLEIYRHGKAGAN
jgi:transposase InsO family protein